VTRSMSCSVRSPSNATQFESGGTRHPEEDRQQACRALFRAALNQDFMPDLRAATNAR